ncbi:RagB/SusD family nutrient uptake outer membrane protein [Pedobacter namyangjuensis]|mgnify:CR=1 FL=1|uniref:RagB/SusD family nutrient uptake outer membrane protein n=1 Tax=Pedobacter namyangjuensis TaxID=600626 RepID=UPI0013B389F3|nr:RagB/SusD family nutrient uptake outer membrane protein [Pedobacter namyangjuensis]
MKKLYKIVCASMIALSLSACSKDFLEINPEQQMAVDVVVIDLPTTKAAVMGTYTMLQSAAYYGRSIVVLPDLMADNMYISRKNSNRYTSYDLYTTNTNDGTASGSWNIMYRTIVNANIIIAKGEKLTVATSEQAEVNHLVGEAYALRALAHFDLLRLYALPYNATAGATHLGVPVLIKSGTSKEDIINPKRNTVKEGYTQIVDDLKKAIALMPTTPVGFSASNKGHISHYAAKALLARVYLYMEDYPNAELMANDVITANKFTLLTNANLVSGSTNFRTQNNAEAIFEVVYNSTSNLGTDRLAAFLFQGSSYGDGLATDDLYNAYTATDVRRGFMTKSSRSGGENPANLITKYNNITTFEEGVKVIRLSEVYLIRAEARAKQTGKDALAAADLDVIAKRADASKPTTTATGAALQTLILEENRKEFAFEGHRLFDLTRNKLAFTKHRTGGLTIAIPANSNKTVLPIPLAEMNANPNMQQNEAYK